MIKENFMEVKNMILFTILLSLAIAIAMVAAIVSVIAGGSIIAIFGDFIVFGLIIWLIVKIFRKKK